jgi:hypothetical protein
MFRKVFEKFWGLFNKFYNKLSIHTKLDEIAAKTQNELSLLCDLYGSDKGSFYGKRAAHTYTSVYEYLFSGIRSNVELVFECGLGTNNPNIPSNMGINGRPGASLRVWRDYFPNAQIIGVDIDKDILFSEDRIETGYIDQTSPETIRGFFTFLEEKHQNNFDIMIDDGLHTFEAAKCLFENAFVHLKETGIYAIEDMHDNDILRFKEYFKSQYSPSEIYVEYMLMPVGVHRSDNNLIIIRKQTRPRPCGRLT